MIRKTDFLLVLILLLIGGAALLVCLTDAPLRQGDPRLDFPVNLVVQDDGDAKITVGIRNEGPVTFPGAETFAAALRVRHAQNGVLRVRRILTAVEPLAPGESAYPLGWEGKLAPGDYQLVWGAPGHGSTVATFTVVANGWTMLALETESNAALPEVGNGSP